MKRDKTVLSPSGLTPTKKRRRRRRTNRTNEQLKITQTLSALERNGIDQLKKMCRERNLSDKGKSKLQVIARLLPFVENLTLQDAETDEIVVYLKEHGLSCMGTREEKRLRLEEHLGITKTKASKLSGDDTEAPPLSFENSPIVHIDIPVQPTILCEVTGFEETGFSPKSPHQKPSFVSEIFNISISHDDLNRLKKGQELNDQIIDYWLKHLESKSKKDHIILLSSQETGLMSYDTTRCAERIRKNVRLFSTSLILLPFCMASHWFYSQSVTLRAMIHLFYFSIV